MNEYIKAFILSFFAFIIVASFMPQVQAYEIIRAEDIQVSNMSIEGLNKLLQDDNTNNHTYTSGTYDCGYFSRDLAFNASKNGVIMGGAILGHNPNFNGYNNHIVNYIYVNNTLTFIEPQTDEIFDFNQSGYEFYKLYPDGKNVPSRW